MEARERVGGQQRVDRLAEDGNRDRAEYRAAKRDIGVGLVGFDLRLVARIAARCGQRADTEPIFGIGVDDAIFDVGAEIGEARIIIAAKGGLEGARDQPLERIAFVLDILIDAAEVEGEVGRKTRVLCELGTAAQVTATGDSVFVRVDPAQFL